VSRIVIALGGNALLRRGAPAAATRQQENLLAAAPALADLALEHELVLTHGNGPQVGLLALEAEAYDEVRPYPLDLLGAESQGMIGYLLAQALTGLVERDVAALLTRVEVDPGDPAFATPSKPIGPIYPEAEARRRATEGNWSIARDGDHYRRVVPSPAPRRIVELPLIRRLVEAGVLVVCAGGGGVPVVRSGGTFRGVEAVIDKDLTASLLARELGAERLVILTDVAHVDHGWGTAGARAIHRATPAELRRLSFAPGSLAPKVEAACRFVEATGGVAVIGSLDEATAVASGDAGTQVVPERPRAKRRRHPTGAGVR
jgi:carbamate kinase